MIGWVSLVNDERNEGMLRSINGSSLEFVDLKHDKEQQATKVQFCSRDKIVVCKKEAKDVIKLCV